MYVNIIIQLFIIWFLKFSVQTDSKYIAGQRFLSFPIHIVD